MNGKYDDIINLPHHVSSRHTPMSMESRAAQFAPFAALNGHDEAISEVGRYVEHKIEISREEKQMLSRVIQTAIQLRDKGLVRITYFVSDPAKKGGFNRLTSGIIRKIDTIEKIMLLDTGEKIPLDDIVEAELQDYNIF